MTARVPNTCQTCEADIRAMCSLNILQLRLCTKQAAKVVNEKEENADEQ